VRLEDLPTGYRGLLQPASTIGYGEVIDLSAHPAGRVFNILFIILSLGTIAFAVSSITAFIVEGELKNMLGRRRMEKDIAKGRDLRICIQPAGRWRPDRRLGCTYLTSSDQSLYDDFGSGSKAEWFPFTPIPERAEFMDKSAIQGIIISSLNTVLLDRGKDIELPLPAFDGATPLFGPHSIVDSLTLVSLIVDVEQRLNEEMGVSVIIADERAMSQERSPFRTIGSLSDYIQRLVDEAESHA
jgi:acyl carrier protein